MKDDGMKPMTESEIRGLIQAGGHDGGADGDWRGPFGYGHRAYRPDPEAQYVFDPGRPRVLAQQRQPEPETIWKRPLR